jgi:lysophospholipid acyltransferase (LPLAT)-like uncharacterized protein
VRLYFKLHILPYIAYFLHRLLSWSWRVELHLSDELRSCWQRKEPVIYAHWHEDETVLILVIRLFRAAILNSKSSDGQMMAKIVQLYGAKTAKGSSSRDGVEALKGLVRLTKAGFNPTVAVDGPRGPRHQVKPGIFQLSRLCQAKIFPGSVAYENAWHFPRSWDKAYLPKPFSRVVITWGQPMPAIESKFDPRSEQLALRLKESLENNKEQALKLFADKQTKC